MVNKKLGIDAEKLIEQIFVVVVVFLADRAACDVAHGVQAVLLELF